MANDPELERRVNALASSPAEDVGVELVDVEVKGARGSRVVRLVADAEEGLDVDRIAQLSRRVGEALDAEDVIDGAYTLEVTSPGVDRPLRTDRDFRRNLTRDVRVVRTREAMDRGEKGEVTGTVVDVRDDRIVLDVDGVELEVPLDDVDHGKIVLPW